ncbi:Saccharopine dehydrogenase [Stipitochalara longipes BDJ]|nr:Saccharopine dehydrogenase [Stipitochalara longipes BDJ]
MAKASREYDIIVLGANGYTASIATEYITEKLPTNLKWAMAGRSRKKLQFQVDRLSSLYSDRLSPGIEIVHLEPRELDALARKTRLIINGIGPYHLYSSPVIEACARTGTHCVGFSLETPWVEEMIRKFDSLAKKTGSIGGSRR